MFHVKQTDDRSGSLSVLVAALGWADVVEAIASGSARCLGIHAFVDLARGG
ncbi:MAG: hypothetical protein RJB60_921, partial [Pseudomonadota bacterium]